LGKSVHLKRPGRGQISGFGLPLTAVTKNRITKTFWANLRKFGQKFLRTPKTWLANKPLGQKAFFKPSKTG